MSGVFGRLDCVVRRDRYSGIDIDKIQSVGLLQLTAQASQPRPKDCIVRRDRQSDIDIDMIRGYATDQFVLGVPLGHRRPDFVPTGSHVVRVRKRASSWAGVEIGLELGFYLYTYHKLVMRLILTSRNPISEIVEIRAMKDEMIEMKALMSSYLKKHVEPSEELSNAIATVLNINNNSQIKCKLLDWYGSGEIVAEGRWSSNDLAAMVHHVPIGPHAITSLEKLSRMVTHSRSKVVTPQSKLIGMARFKDLE
uniref:Uncharacterized protein n=1 Tax=Cucumis melo TaxID=3656 RepID=A0A9I9E6X4_CUCME